MKPQEKGNIISILVQDIFICNTNMYSNILQYDITIKINFFFS